MIGKIAPAGNLALVIEAKQVLLQTINSSLALELAVVAKGPTMNLFDDELADGSFGDTAE